MTYDDIFMGEACHEAARSIDPSTQNGAVLVHFGNLDAPTIIGRGWNRFPEGIADIPERWENRERKYGLVIHAEEAAIIDACRRGFAQMIKGSGLYCPWAACRECAKKIADWGLGQLVIHRACEEASAGHWQVERDAGLATIREKGIPVRYAVAGGARPAPVLRLNYGTWTP